MLREQGLAHPLLGGVVSGALGMRADDELARMIGDLPTLPSNVLICLEHTELLTPKIIEANARDLA